MNLEEASEMWRTFKDYIPAKDLHSAAEQFVNAVSSMDLVDEDLWSLAELDPHIESVVQDMLEVEDDFSSNDDDWND